MPPHASHRSLRHPPCPRHDCANRGNEGVLDSFCAYFAGRQLANGTNVVMMRRAGACRCLRWAAPLSVCTACAWPGAAAELCACDGIRRRRPAHCSADGATDVVLRAPDDKTPFSEVGTLAGGGAGHALACGTLHAVQRCRRASAQARGPMLCAPAPTTRCPCSPPHVQTPPGVSIADPCLGKALWGIYMGPKAPAPDACKAWLAALPPLIGA